MKKKIETFVCVCFFQQLYDNTIKWYELNSISGFGDYYGHSESKQFRNNADDRSTRTEQRTENREQRREENTTKRTKRKKEFQDSSKIEKVAEKSITLEHQKC